MTRVKIIYFARFSRELNLKRRITKLEIEWTREGDTYYNDNVYRKRYLTHIFLQYPVTQYLQLTERAMESNPKCI